MKATYTRVLGRRIIGRLEPETDLIASLTRRCRLDRVAAASVSIRGSVRSFTVGCFDPAQKVFVTQAHVHSMEIVACRGLFTESPTGGFFHAHILLADSQGAVTAGRLFPETIVYAAEFDLQELLGPPLERRYDVCSGQMHLHLNAPLPT
jgi:predicted DNA-binding protein with PD1-like motif